MRIVHLEAVLMPSGRVFVRPSGALGTHGSHQGVMWAGVYVSTTNPDTVRRAWHLENPQLRAASVNAPVIEGKP